MKSESTVGKMYAKTMKLVLGGVIVALGTVLSMIKVYELPYGGSITLCAMLPVLFYAYKYGPKWGVSVGLVYSVTQFVLGTGAIRGFSLMTAFGVIVFDFLLAFSVLGTAGIFKKLIKNDVIAFGLGAAFAIILRYISHIISGVIFFGSYADWYFGQEGMKMGAGILSGFSGNALIWIYSVIYNGSYIIPELIITVAAGCLIMKFVGRQLLDRLA